MEHLLHYVWKHKLFPLKGFFVKFGGTSSIVNK